MLLFVELFCVAVHQGALVIFEGHLGEQFILLNAAHELVNLERLEIELFVLKARMMGCAALFHLVQLPLVNCKLVFFEGFCC